MVESVRTGTRARFEQSHRQPAGSAERTARLGSHECADARCRRQWHILGSGRDLEAGERSDMELRSPVRSSDTADAVGETRTRRRVRNVAFVALAGLLLAVLWSVTAGLRSPSPIDDLRVRLQRSDVASSTQFSYISGGTRVVDCTMRNLRYGGITDPSAGRVVAWLDEQPDLAGVVATADSRAVLLHRTLFENPAFVSDWVSFPRPLSDADRATITEIAGQPLGADLIAPTPPPVAPDLVIAALDVAASVQYLGSSEFDGRPLDGYRIEIDADQLDEIDGTSAASEQPGPRLVPQLGVWLTDGDVVARIEVRSQNLDGTLGAAENGWIVEYESTDAKLRSPNPADVRNVAAVDRSQLRPSALECAVQM